MGLLIKIQNLNLAAALSYWTRLFTPIVPRRSLHISFYQLSGHRRKIKTGKKNSVKMAVVLSVRMVKVRFIRTLMATDQKKCSSYQKFM